MSREELINRTLTTLSRLPQDRLQEVSDFADFVLKKYDEEILQEGMEKLSSDSGSLKFLEEEENLYSTKDLKEKY